jgi:hypothetical protein
MASEKRAVRPVRRAALCCLAAVLLALLSVAPARAQAQPRAPGKVPSAEPAPSPADRETARSLLKSGDAKYAAADYVGALEDYLAADSLMGVPTTRVSVGKAQAAMGQLVEARDTLLGVKRIPVAKDEGRAYVDARDEAELLAEEIGARIPALTLVPSGVPKGTAVSVMVDREPLSPEQLSLPRKLNPGEHHIAATATGFQPIDQRITLAEREHRELELGFQPWAGASEPAANPVPSAPAPHALAPSHSGEASPSAADEPSGSSVSAAVWVGLGIGAAGLVAGTVAGVVASSRASDLKDRCPDGRCPRAETEDDYDRALVAAHASTVGFAVAGAGALVCLVGALVTAWSSDSKPPPLEPVALEPVLGIGAAGLRGRF